MGVVLLYGIEALEDAARLEPGHLPPGVLRLQS